MEMSQELEGDFPDVAFTTQGSYLCTGLVEIAELEIELRQVGREWYTKLFSWLKRRRNTKLAPLDKNPYEVLHLGRGPVNYNKGRA